MFCCNAVIPCVLKRNKHIHSMTSNGRYELRIDLTDQSYTKKYAVYKMFVVGDAASKYKLTIAGYSGDAGNYKNPF